MCYFGKVETIMETGLTLFQEAVKTQWDQKDVLFLGIYFIAVEIMFDYRETRQSLIQDLNE
jgi:hypothetical protein